MSNLNSTVLLIAAYDKSYGIGNNNKLLYHIKEDLEFFKQMTEGSVLVMGRLTFESLPKLLPGRKHVVVSGKPESWVKKYANQYGDGAFLVARSLNQALELADKVATEDKHKRISVIGGASIYAQALPIADELCLTEIQARRDADTYFPVEALREQLKLMAEMSCSEVTSESGIGLKFKVFKRIDRVSEDETLYVNPIGDRQLAVMRTVNGEERIVLGKIVSYRPERGTPTVVVGDDSGKERRYRFSSTAARNRAIVDLDNLIGRSDRSDGPIQPLINLSSHSVETE